METRSRPPQGQPWENGWAGDPSPPLGTRRLWLAVVLALATGVAAISPGPVPVRRRDRVRADLVRHAAEGRRPLDTGPEPSASAERPSDGRPQGDSWSLQAVNYPDSYWHVSGGLITLDQVVGS
ncbi:hypothetical protein U5640_43250 [Streptomyces sp. SS7]|uniref:hypothetical protein n=1 Tax=Streptomyces sp. SS7 TaxID=3108485 RepID=UPI0030EBA0CA